MQEELNWLGIADLKAAYARGELSPSRYVAAQLDRIERLNPRLKAFIEIDRERAMSDARECDRRFQEDQPRPLEGITMGIKSNIAVKGLELNAGMASRRDIVAEEDADCVEKLRAAGVVILGSLNMHEAALGATTDNLAYGRCLNPHGLNQGGDGRTPGGSSGGSGAAVAAGLCTAALGTDTLGSVRIPAAYCGVYGLKPTHSSISTKGLVPLCDSLDAIGPLARSMDDLSYLSNILFAPDLATAMQRARFVTLDDLGGVEYEPEIGRAYLSAISALPTVPDRMSLPYSAKRIRTAGFARAARELAVHMVPLGEDRCSLMSDDLVRLIEFGLSRDEALLAEDEEILADVKAQITFALGTNGILVLPTAPQVAFLHDTRAPVNQADWTGLANIAGLPAVSLPMGLGADQMPIGIQLVGPAGAEALLISQARAMDERLRAYTPPKGW
jgi:aspartyl-tRNA(Asn)/glutamyl-tRNA(Gln) amidotransferase subunit A